MEPPAALAEVSEMQEKATKTAQIPTWETNDFLKPGVVFSIFNP